MQKKLSVEYQSKSFDLIKDPDIVQQKYTVQEAVECVFHNEIKNQLNQIRFMRYDRKLSSAMSFETKSFRNGCLVILPCRIGMTKVEQCYVEPIRYIFHWPNISMGAMGGRPNQALYFVGLQKDELIFMDPHLVQDAVEHDDYLYEDWLNCEAQDMSSSGRKAGVAFTQSTQETKIKEENRQTYHCTQMRTIQISKIDPTIAFAFYLRNESDFKQFYSRMEQGKKRFKGDWPFSMMDPDWMKDYYMSQKSKEKSASESVGGKVDFSFSGKNFSTQFKQNIQIKHNTKEEVFSPVQEEEDVEDEIEQK